MRGENKKRLVECFVCFVCFFVFFFFNDTATTEIYTLSLHDALPISQNAINFWNEDKTQDEHVITHCYRFESVQVLDHSLLYAASTSKLQLVLISTTKDGCGIRGKAETVAKYKHDWGSVGSLAVLEHSLYASHRQGIDEISLITHELLRIVTQGVSYSAPSPSIVEYEGGILYTNTASHCVMLWSKKEGTVKCFARNTWQSW